ALALVVVDFCPHRASSPCPPTTSYSLSGARRRVGSQDNHLYRQTEASAEAARPTADDLDDGAPLLLSYPIYTLDFFGAPNKAS
ncbi:hypothetical protein RTBOTA2_003079, partial [Rhodotorula toruloides]